MPAGQTNKICINNGATWGTAISSNFAGAGILAASFDVDTTRESTAVEAMGMTVAGQRNASTLACSGNLSAPFTYNHMPRLFTLFAADTVTGSSPYTHTFSAPTTNRNMFITVAELIQNVGGADKYREVNSAVGTSFSISGDINSTIQCSFDLLADKLVTPATVNTALGTATLPATNSFVRMGCGDSDFFKIADQGSDPAELAIAGFTFTYNVPREGGDYDTGSATIGLPDETGAHSCTLEIRLSKLATTDHAADLLTDQASNALFTFPTVSTGGQNCLATLKLPHLRLVSTPSPTSGPGKLTQTLTYDVLADDASSANAHSNAQTTGGVAWELAVTNSDAGDYDSALS